MNNIIIGDSYLCQANIDNLNANSQFNFINIPEIANNNIILYGIEAYSSTQLAVSPIDGSAVAPIAGIPSISFTLVEPGNVQKVNDMPMYNAIRSLNQGNVLLFEGIRLNLTSSFITLNAGTGLTAGQCALFMLYFKFLDK